MLSGMVVHQKATRWPGIVRVASQVLRLSTDLGSQEFLGAPICKCLKPDGLWYIGVRIGDLFIETPILLRIVQGGDTSGLQES